MKIHSKKRTTWFYDDFKRIIDHKTFIARAQLERVGSTVTKSK
jgi:hypothetical protein